MKMLKYMTEKQGCFFRWKSEYVGSSKVVPSFVSCRICRHRRSLVTLTLGLSPTGNPTNRPQIDFLLALS